MSLKLMLEKIAEYRKELPTNCIVLTPLRALEEKIKVISASKNNSCIYAKIEKTWLVIDGILDYLHENPPSPFTFHSTKVKTTYEERVLALMKRESAYQENKNLCESTLDFLKSLEQIDLNPSKKEKVEPDISPLKTVDSIKKNKKTAPALCVKTRKSLQNFTFLNSNNLRFNNNLSGISREEQNTSITAMVDTNSMPSPSAISNLDFIRKRSSTKSQENTLQKRHQVGSKTC